MPCSQVITFFCQDTVFSCIFLAHVEDNICEVCRMATFGDWTLLERINGRNARYLCRCSCGELRIILWSSLKSGDSTSCGCKTRQQINQRLVGKTFGGITVLANVGRYKGKQSIWLCRCHCGKEFTHRYPSKTKSCGCTRYNSATKHGLHKHPLYQIWAAMKNRCLNPHNSRAHRYSARGINICQEWMDFTEFYSFALNHGWEKGLMIDRINNDGGYEPDNIRFVTPATSGQNRSTTKLNVEDVQAIRESAGNTQSLANRYQVTTVHINAIKRHDKWKHEARS
jgi:hypothetical protein